MKLADRSRMNKQWTQLMESSEALLTAASGSTFDDAGAAARRLMQDPPEWRRWETEFGAALRKVVIPARRMEQIRLLLEGRYRALKGALAKADPELLTVLPFNSGCFALVELPEKLGLDSETVRRHLLARHDTGLISIEPRYLRIAHCSVDAAALPELARRLELGVKELTV
jgi:hypothetical protein